MPMSQICDIFKSQPVLKSILQLQMGVSTNFLNCMVELLVFVGASPRI